MVFREGRLGIRTLGILAGCQWCNWLEKVTAYDDPRLARKQCFGR